MAMNALVDSFCHNQKKCGTERFKVVFTKNCHLYATFLNIVLFVNA